MLKADGVLIAAVEDVREALARARVRHPDWFQDFAAEEARALALHYYEVQAVPGLLQTPAYARSSSRTIAPCWTRRVAQRRTVELQIMPLLGKV
ncbi:Scr1 family TA system antitoxin-like transcriptional regulator [Streptomyces sp. NPDC048717]|uniref:Scr1 family TA system antitoxin-like transcriptional regulator n=1 Tax=Streptomyces sp. NPDC048717 TaxID=3154928 RepID=UPI0034251542